MAVAIVGARNASAAACRFARGLAHDLGQNDLVVVVRWIGSGTHVGEVNGIRPTGNFLFRINDALNLDHVWTMTPSMAGSALSASMASTTVDSVASPSSSANRASIPTFAQPRRICSRYTVEGASRPMITTARPGGRPCSRVNRSTSSATAARISAAAQVCAPPG